MAWSSSIACSTSARSTEPTCAASRTRAVRITRPVTEHTTSVSRKVCVIDTSAWRTGSRVAAAAATMPAEPRPLSFENTPRAMPKRSAVATDAPSMPPPKAVGVKAALNVTYSASGIQRAFSTRMTTPLIT